MTELTLSTDIKQIEFEINHYKQLAGQSIWEIGKRLNHVKENDLVHGEFMRWVNQIGLSQAEANRMMRVSKELPNSPTLVNLGSTVLELITTLPREEKEEQLQRIEEGDSPTVRELREIKRKLSRQAQELKEKEDIINKQHKQILDNKPKIEVKEVEVIPVDYELTKQQLIDEEQRTSELRREVKALKDELTKQDENSKRYEELTEAIHEMEGKMSRSQKRIQAQKQVYDLVDISKELLTKVTPIPYLVDVDYVRDNHVAMRELQKVADQTRKFLKNLEEVLKESEIIEGEIING